MEQLFFLEHISRFLKNLIGELNH